MQFFKEIRMAATFVVGVVLVVALVMGLVEGVSSAMQHGLLAGLMSFADEAFRVVAAIWRAALGVMVVLLVIIMFRHNDDPELGDG
jgi:thiamine transporter ThiT